MHPAAPPPPTRLERLVLDHHKCRHPTVLAPTSGERLWVGSLDRETRETAFSGLAALR